MSYFSYCELNISLDISRWNKRGFNIKNSKLKLYEIAVKWRLIFYLIAASIVLIPISIVLITDNTFKLFSSEVIVNTALLFIIIGKILTAYKENIENGCINWGSIGVITGLLIVFVRNALK